MPKLGKIKKYQFPNNMIEVDHMTGREFEEFVANVFNYTEDYVIKEWPGKKMSDDYGIDVVLEDSEKTRYGIQCKRFGPTTNLNESELVKMLNGAVVHKITKKEAATDPDVADSYYLVLVTTAYEKQLSTRAMKFIRTHNIEAYYREDVVSFLKEVHEKEGREIKSYNYENLAFDQTAKSGGSYKQNSEFISFLKNERKNIATYNEIPLQKVFSNKTLEEIVNNEPIKLDELREIKGFSNEKIELFGQYLVNRVAKYLGKPIEKPVKKSKKSDEELYDALVKLRKEVLNEFDNYFKAYNVYKNVVIEELIEKRPESEEELLEITSFGPKKVEQFGKRIIKMFK